MKGYRRKSVLILFGVVSLVTLAAVLLRDREPAYQGIPLSFWIDQLQKRTAHEQAEIAIHEIGLKTIPFLFGEIRDEDSSYRRAMIAVWANLPAALQEHLPAPKARDPFLPRKVGYALSLLGSPALPYVLAALNDPDDRIRHAAIEAVGGMGSSADAAVPALIALLKDSHGRLRFEAVLALERMGPARRQAIPALISLLRDSSAEPEFETGASVREAAVAALGRIGPDAAVAIPDLTMLWTDTNASARIRQEAAVSLWRTKRDPKVVSWLITQLEPATDFETCARLISALASMGAAAKDAIPVIEEKMSHPNPSRNPVGRDLSRMARAALTRIDPRWAQGLSEGQLRILEEAAQTPRRR